MIATTIIADDLTGALDSAVQFRTGADVSVAVEVDAIHPISADVVAHLVPSRDATKADAIRMADAAWPLYGRGGRTFKKIDSMLRGHWVMEVLAAARRPEIDRIILAPAAPRLGRITVGGVQFGPDGRPVADVAALLRGGGTSDIAVWSPRAAVPAHVGIVVGDAQSDADLEALVAMAGSLPRRTLWCGSAGLASALAGGRPMQCQLAALDAPRQAIIGTNHPVTTGQLAALAARAPHRVYAVREADDTARAGTALYFTDLPEGGEALSIERRMARVLPSLPTSGCYLVTGGETLQTLCRLVQAEWFSVVGELAPGIVTSTLHSKRWGKTQIVSKSGGFGEVGLLSAFFG